MTPLPFHDKINVFQLAQLLPMEENFLLLFRFDNPLESSVEFMKVTKCDFVSLCISVSNYIN